MSASSSYMFLEFINTTIPVTSQIESCHSGEDMQDLVKVIGQLFTSIGTKSGLPFGFKCQLLRMATLVHIHWSPDFLIDHYETIHCMIPSIFAQVDPQLGETTFAASDTRCFGRH